MTLDASLIGETFLILLSGASVAIAAISDNTGVALNATVSLTGPAALCSLLIVCAL